MIEFECSKWVVLVGVLELCQKVQGGIGLDGNMRTGKAMFNCYPPVNATKIGSEIGAPTPWYHWS